MIEGVVGNSAEQYALEVIIKPVIQESSWSTIVPNYKVTLGDGSNRFLDFAIISGRSRIAIEIDGYTFHAQGAISREKFDDQLERQNELVLQGWNILRFSFDQTQQKAERCRGQLRRLIIDDDQLHRNYSSVATQPTSIQNEALDALSKSRKYGIRKGLIALPTGTGKTILSALDAKNVGGRVLFVAHNNEILHQAARAYQKVLGNINVGFLNSTEEHSLDRDYIFANVASLRAHGRLEAFSRDHFSYIVIDEFHHGAAPSYQKLLTYFNAKFTLGLTATPDRTDRQDVIALLDGNLIFSISTAEAIDRGFLAPFTYYGLKDNVDYRSIRHNGYRYDANDLEKALLIPARDEAIFEKYTELAPNAKAIGFCVSIKHAERMADVFNERGIASVAIHSGLKFEERAVRIRQFELGAVRCAFTRDLFNEGVDVPDTDALLFLRPTESKIVFTQQLGRGLRISPGKKSVRVLDFISNYKGAELLPEIVNSIARDGPLERDQWGTKPELVLDNGCRIFFESEAIQNLVLPVASKINPLLHYEKVASRSERLDRPLSPIDLHLLLEDGLAQAIIASGGYVGFARRMNGVDEESEVIDVEFLDVEFSTSIEYATSIEEVASIGAVALDAIDRMLDLMGQMPLGHPYKRGVNLAWDVHDLCTELTKILAPMLLIRSSVVALSTEADVILPHGNTESIECCEPFFDFLRRHSVRRDSYSQVNYIKSEGRNIFGLPRAVINSANPESAAVVALARLIDKRSLTWLTDLLDLTSHRSVDY